MAILTKKAKGKAVRIVIAQRNPPSFVLESKMLKSPLYSQKTTLFFMLVALLFFDLAWCDNPRSPQSENQQVTRIFKSQKDSVVRVTVLDITSYLTPNGQAGKTSHKWSMDGTVIGPNGLTAVSSIAADPWHTKTLIYWEDSLKLKTMSNSREFNLTSHDGHPVKMKLAGKLPELDLTLLLPIDEQAHLPSVQLEAGARPELGDKVINIRRLSAAHDAVPAVDVVSVTTIMHEPHLSFMVDQCYPGCPIFDLQGNCLGVALLSQVEPGKVRQYHDSRGGLSVRIVPAEVILKSVASLLRVE